jgi:hypothetical protein
LNFSAALRLSARIGGDFPDSEAPPDASLKNADHCSYIYDQKVIRHSKNRASLSTSQVEQPATQSEEVKHNLKREQESEKGPGQKRTRRQ